MREKILFDDNWLFHEGDIDVQTPTQKGPLYTQSKTERSKWGPACKDYFAEEDPYTASKAYNSERWISVTLPHDYIISQAPNEKENNALGYFKYQNAWYRKKFRVSKEDMEKRLTLLFEGVATHCTIYLNGCLMKHNFCGYTSFEVDITDTVNFEEENVLAVYVNTEHHEGWWYEGAGIYRHVWLIKTDTIAVDLWGLYAMPVQIKEDLWEVPAQITVLNSEFTDHEVTVFCRVISPEGEVVAAGEAKGQVPLRERADIHCSIKVEKPILWDIEHPVLYHVEAELFTNGVQRDKAEIRTGFRTFEADGTNGLRLNGKPVTIQGVCCHQDFGLTGKAVPDNIQKHKIKLIKEMGANGFRCSHYPHGEATMDALDEMGFIVMAETRWFESTEEGLEQLSMVVKRDRNRPSVCFWSVGNEEPYFVTEQGRRICKSMMAHLRKLDNTRFVMAAVDKNPDVATVYDELDVIGINYNLDKYDIIHEKFPDKAVFASECCATGTTRGWYGADSPERGYLSAYDKDTTKWFLGREKTWKFLANRPWVMGGYQWIAIDHRGECFWPRLCSQSGAIDLFLQKKDAFYQNQAMWIKERPVIHLLPHWNFKGYEGEKIPVWTYTNCEEAELFLNDNSLGRISIEPLGHGQWQVPYEQGILTVKGYRNGREVCSDEVKTTGNAVKLLLRAENTVSANGKDVAIITCYCADEQGNMVPDASPEVSFYVNGGGKVIGTGSDVSDHSAVTLPFRKMRAGLITAAVKPHKGAQCVKLCAESFGLESAVLSIPLEEIDKD